MIGRPFDDPKGRWRVGGGINVPVKIKWKQLEARSGNYSQTRSSVPVANELMNSFTEK